MKEYDHQRRVERRKLSRVRKKRERNLSYRQKCEL